MCEGEHLLVEVRIIVVVTALKDLKVGGILLVGEIICGEVQGIESERLCESIPPVLDGLPRNREHEIDADIFDSGLAQETDRGGNVGRLMLATESGENFGMKRLRAQ